MWQLSIVLLLSHLVGTAYVSEITPFTSRLIKIFDKLDKLTAPIQTPPPSVQPLTSPIVTSEPTNTTQSPGNVLFAKLEKLNAIKPKDVNDTNSEDQNSESVENVNVTTVTEKTSSVPPTKVTTVTPKLKLKHRHRNMTGDHAHTPDKTLNEDDDELLSAIQIMGKMSADQLENVALEMMRIKGGTKAAMPDYEADWEDDLNMLGEEDYPNDDWDNEYPDSMSPSSITKVGPGLDEYTLVDPVRATARRPKVIYERPSYISHFLASAIEHIKSVVINGKCHTPQPRWLTVKQLAPSADTVYMPSQVQLHRCMDDSGCCLDESQHCAPVTGEYVTLPFYLNKANGNFVARIVFYNHTRCGCISKSVTSPSPTNATLISSKHHHRSVGALGEEGSSGSQSVEEGEEGVMPRYSEPSMEQDGAPLTKEPYIVTALPPTEMKRCTCPSLFQAKHVDKRCSCVCEWADHNRRRDCLSLSRGREHFGLRDRVCVANGDCSMPTCEYGVYDKTSGRCPIRRIKRRYPKGRMG